ncbi:hypothetical protein SAMN05518849_101532 [Sphingobium sp. AP50]|uniref:hypothetical protein n=1 Tax=Sphingobium sp. AP50 TaxID=1884369 RepID=UPI0008D61735|nr:hypothetical protein [Sphingobium sp. AP50]SEI67912.1 hypothetical protein SAMN05518849_101532 [Sphingobium sp. AP50]
MTLAGLSPAGVLLVRAGEPLVLRFILQDAAGDPQDLIGRTFALTLRRSSRIVPIVTIDGELTEDGAAVMIAITAEQATALYESGQSQALSYDFVELSGGASITRWTARVNIAEGPELPSDIVPVWIELPYSEATVNPQTIAVRERGARGRSPQEVLFDAGLIDAPTVDAMLQLIKQNQTWTSTADLEAAGISGGSAVLTENGKAGLFTIGDYATYAAQVEADTGKINYIRSTYDATKVWVRTSIQQQAAGQIGATGGATVQAELEANKSATIIRTGGTLTSREAGVRIDDEDSSQNVLQWLEDCQKRSSVAVLSKEDFEDAPGTYTCAPVPVEMLAGKELRIDARPGTAIKGLSDGVLNGVPIVNSIAALRFQGPDHADPLDPSIPNLHIRGLRVDVSDRTYSLAAPSGTAITIRDIGHATFDLCDFYGGPDYQAALDAVDPVSRTTIGGDSAISFTRIRNFDFSRSRARGFLDKIWYGSLSGRMRGWANFYYDSNTAGAFNRDGTSITLWGEKVRGCGLGFGMTEGNIGSVTYPPAHDLFATDCEFDEMGGRIFRIYMASAKIKGCKVRDWGYQPRKAASGLYVPVPSLAAVRLDGAYNCEIEMDISMRDWPDTANHVGFDLRDKTLNGVKWTCRDNNIRASVSGLPNGLALLEFGGTDRTNSTIMVDNVGTNRVAEYPVQSRSTNMSTHKVRPRGSKEYTLRNNQKLSTYFTLTPIALNSSKVVFGAPAANECHAQRVGDESLTHIRNVTPFTLGSDASFVGEIIGTVLHVTQMTSGALAVGHCVRWTGMEYSPVIVPGGTGTGGVGTYNLDLMQTVPAGTAMLSLMDGEIRFDAQTFAAAVGVGSIEGNLLTVSSTSSGSWAVGQTVKGEGTLSKTTILENLGGGHYTVSRSQSVPSGPITGFTVSTVRGRCSIVGTTMSVISLAVGALAVGQGIEGDNIIPGTLLMENLGGGNWRVNKSHADAVETNFRTLPSGLPWIAAPAGGGDAEGVTGIDDGVIFPAKSRTLVGQVPAGRDYIRCWWQTMGRALRVRDLNPEDGTIRANITIVYRCED